MLPANEAGHRERRRRELIEEGPGGVLPPENFEN